LVRTICPRLPPQKPLECALLKNRGGKSFVYDMEESHLLGILPERRKNSERITWESIMNWGKKAVVDNTEVRDIFFIQVELDEADIESSGIIPLSELRKRLKR